MDTKIFLQIEEYINNRFGNITIDLSGKVRKEKSSLSHVINDEFFKDFDKKLNKRLGEITDQTTLYDLLLKHIKKLGRTDFYFKGGKRDGELNGAKFCEYAHIDKSTWSNIQLNIGKPSKETLLKLVIALKLEKPDAEEVMKKGLNPFDEHEFRDQLILALIEYKYYDYITVYEVLERYRNDGLPEHKFDNIYDTPDIKRENKNESK